MDSSSPTWRAPRMPPPPVTAAYVVARTQGTDPAEACWRGSQLAARQLTERKALARDEVCS